MNNIIVCGKSFPINTKVVLWNEPNGLNAYDTTQYTYKTQNRKTGKTESTTIKGKRYNPRFRNPTLQKLQDNITQLFFHHSGLYNAQTTFNVLHKERGLSCHFILSDDGTLYQTLDLQEKAFHGGSCNQNSIGIEIDSRANADRYPNAYDEYHQKNYNVLPRKKRVDFINGQKITGYTYNEPQYEALIKLKNIICNIFPIIGANADFPRENNQIIKKVIPNPTKHKGFICHFNTNPHKIDPIAFDFDRITNVIDFSTLKLQQSLQSLGYDPGPIDGIFGPKTKQALIKFQEDNCIIPGILNQHTIDILKSKLK